MSNRLLIIAHRGGVVDAARSENSFAALEEAIRRGYSHVEIDARITADGHVICFHNDDLKEEAGISGRISELPLATVTQTVLTCSQETIPTFEAYCARCAGRIGVMVDLKGCPDEAVESYADEIEAALQKHGLLEEALFLTNKVPIRNQAEIAQIFRGKAKIAWRHSLAEAQESAKTRPGFADDFYIFNHGADFAAENVAGFQALGLLVIVSINTGHYRQGDPLEQGRRHLREMLDYGVDGVQIDSVYDEVLFG